MPDNNKHSFKRISRRAVLGTAAAMAATPALAAGCPIGPPAHEKGPKIWMDMDQVELDAAYDQAAYAPLIGQIQKRFATSSETTRARLGAPKRLAYGPTPTEALDLYPAKSPNAPIFIFVHGGRWLFGKSKDYGYPADLFVNAGVNYVALDFIAVDAANGDIRPMADQVRRAIAWVLKNAATLVATLNGSMCAGIRPAVISAVSCSLKSSGQVIQILARLYMVTINLLNHSIHYTKTNDHFLPAHAAPISNSTTTWSSLLVRSSISTDDQSADNSHLRRLRVAGVPAPKPRFCLGGEDRRKAGRIDRSTELHTVEMCESLGNPYGPTKLMKLA